MKRENEYLYTKLSNILRDQILTGYIKPGEFLLSENQLADYYEMSRVSVRKSLETLMNEGLVVKKPGQGTIVTPNLVLPENMNKSLNILATSPSFYADTALNDIIDKFHEDYPNVKVNVISVPDHYLPNRNNEPDNVKLKFDLVFVADDQLSRMPGHEQFLDLGALFEECGCGGKMYGRLIDFFKNNKIMYAMPITVSTVFLAYNPSLFLKNKIDLPSNEWTIDDFYKAAESLTSDTNFDGITDQFGFSVSISLTRWLTLSLQNGVDFKNIVNNTGKLENTLDFLHDLLYRRRSAVLFRNSSNMANPFYSQRAAMTLTSSLEVAGWDKHYMSFKPSVAKLPLKNNNATMLISNCLLVPSDCENTDLACSFIKTALDDGEQKKIASKYKFLSVFKNVNSSVWSEDYLKSINVLDDLNNGKFIYDLFTDNEVRSGVEEDMENYWSGIDSAAITAQNICDIILGR